MLVELRVIGASDTNVAKMDTRTMRRFMLRLLVNSFGAVVIFVPIAFAQVAAGNAQAPSSAQAGGRPEFTAAGFGDWVLRCTQPEGQPKNCEIMQSLNAQGQTVAQFAIGRAAPAQPMRLTLAVPPNVTLDTQPRLLAVAMGNEARGLEFTWKRCFPTACLADMAPSDALLQQLRRQSESAQIKFTSGEGRENTLPLSLRGLSGALDALAREVGR